MKKEEVARVEGLAAAAAYAELDAFAAELSLAGLAKAWSAFKPMTKLALFKLMDPPRALELYGLLPFDERFFLLCAFPLASIAPILETLSPSQKTLFHQMPREYYDRMFRQLVSQTEQAVKP